MSTAGAAAAATQRALCREEPELSLFCVASAPEHVKNAFLISVPPDGAIAILSAEVATDITLEAVILANAKTKLLARTTLPDGGVALLFGP